MALTRKSAKSSGKILSFGRRGEKPKDILVTLHLFRLFFGKIRRLVHIVYLLCPFDHAHRFAALFIRKAQLAGLLTDKALFIDHGAYGRGRGRTPLLCKDAGSKPAIGIP
ncbi:hypothetical protein [Paenibacillus naphthalenovorans]|uniref:hypothetical protein n=1 Tax=Paenibacillus naphthalenovorans TaxID=162209 RepID=UPI0010F62970|nr:hypothetical protein [Paenibacillus naphthalenovorans]